MAEDDPDDQFLMRRAFERCGLSNPLIAVGDGQEAVDYLTGHGPYSDRASHPLPGLLLLDLKMPRLSGFDVLAWLRARPEFKELPVVVFSSSAQELDMRKARGLGADDYQVKPTDFAELEKILRNLHSRWLSGGARVDAKL